MTIFTDSQRTGIETKTRDIVVSAGAGSGKTTVLAERIMRKIEQGASLSDFLAVTFTNEAANDLKGKLAEKLEKMSEEHPENKVCRRMSYLLPNAEIGTIDSFCLRHIRENAAELGLTEGCSVGDAALCGSLLETAADEVLTELCEDDGETADLLLDNFAGCKDDKPLLKAVCGLYEKLRAYPFYMNWFEGVLKSHSEEMRTLEENGFFACKAGSQLKKECGNVLSAIGDNLQTLYTLCENEGQEKFCSALESAVNSLKAALSRTYGEFCEAMSCKIPSRPKGCGEDFVRVHETLKPRLKALGKKYIRSEEQLKLEYAREDEVLRALYVFVSRLDSAYTAAKRERGVLDFADAEHLMLRLLVTPTADGCIKTGLCRRISAQYTDVFIDEYQDINPLQDAIFEAIGSGKRFMVGDVKQSIYGFRNAYPDIFSGYRDHFAPVGDEAPTAAVFLKENFRCGKPVVDFCNFLFDAVFTENSAGTDYKKERLIYGKTEKSCFPARVLVLENADVQAEAERVAAEVKQLIDEGLPPSEIALLTRKRDRLQIFADALKRRGIASFAPKIKRPLLKEPEVLLVLSLLRVIDNPTDDIALAALLRSPIFRFTAAELCLIRRSESSLYADLLSAAKTDLRFIKARFKMTKTKKTVHAPAQKPALIKRMPPSVVEKCAGFAEKLRLYRAKALLLPSRELIWFLYEDTHLFYFAPEGCETRYRSNLFALLDLAQSAESGVYKGVGAFTEYVSRLEKSGMSPDSPTAPDEKTVKLMTIHSAKGLEFRAVFVCGCGDKLSFSMDSKEAITANYRSGISVKLAMQSIAWKQSPLLRDLALEEQKRRLLAEEYRLLYVAFTRAKERLYISAALKTDVESKLRSLSEKPTVYADLFLSALAGQGNGSYIFSVENAGERSCEAADSETASPMPTEPEPARVKAIELPSLKELPNPPTTVTAKYSVSKLKRLENGLLGADDDELVSFKAPAFAAADGAADENGGALKGTANHKFLQFASFADAEMDAAAEAERLQKDGFLTDEEAARLDLEALKRFFASSLYREIRAAKRLYREKRFTTRLPASLFSKDAAGETVLIQGVIDCFFENTGGSYTLVDYKTDFAGASELCRRYGVQLWLYALYIEKVTKKRVSRAVIYSLSQNGAVECALPCHYEDIKGVTKR